QGKTGTVLVFQPTPVVSTALCLRGSLPGPWGRSCACSLAPPAPVGDRCARGHLLAAGCHSITRSIATACVWNTAYRSQSVNIAEGTMAPESLVAKIFAAYGNPLPTPNRSGDVYTSHEPVHASKSGRCVRINVLKDVFICDNCHRGGGPPQALQTFEELSYDEAVAAVQARYGGAGQAAHGNGKAP